MLDKRMSRMQRLQRSSTKQKIFFALYLFVWVFLGFCRKITIALGFFVCFFLNIIFFILFCVFVILLPGTKHIDRQCRARFDFGSSFRYYHWIVCTKYENKSKRKRFSKEKSIDQVQRTLDFGYGTNEFSSLPFSLN